MMLYRNTKVKFRSLDGDTDLFDIIAGVLQEDTLAAYLFIICQENLLGTSIDIKENGFTQKKRKEADDIYIYIYSRYHTITDVYTMISKGNRVSCLYYQ